MPKYTDEEVDGLLAHVRALVEDALVPDDGGAAIVEDSFYALREYYNGLPASKLPAPIRGIVINSEMARSLFIAAWKMLDNGEHDQTGEEPRVTVSSDDFQEVSDLLDTIEATYRDWDIVSHKYKVGDQVEIVARVMDSAVFLERGEIVTIHALTNDGKYILRQGKDSSLYYESEPVEEGYLKAATSKEVPVLQVPEEATGVGYVNPNRPPIYGIDRHQRE